MLYTQLYNVQSFVSSIPSRGFEPQKLPIFEESNKDKAGKVWPAGGPSSKMVEHAILFCLVWLWIRLSFNGSIF